ncbi:predicted protein [Thalassiosira pseudonana CCMP1335]|uniref:Uncharacterized protein n=1 Tax=Thalassiosira pseudonana TaxID=35128 RepID=B8C6N6_THAPS|nr:predicted protein [Thalassiosira pseudonana CCMP1335]EED90836.1 predicted protein [Thalassiosira pseudonana CCMP1335]
MKTNIRPLTSASFRVLARSRRGGCSYSSCSRQLSSPTCSPRRPVVSSFSSPLVVKHPSTRHLRGWQPQGLANNNASLRYNSTSDGSKSEESNSGTTSTIDADTTTTRASSIAEIDSSNLPVNFPWRHSPTTPTRVLDGDDLSGMPNNFRARLVRKIIASRELNRTFWEVVPVPFYVHEWEGELASNFTTAFSLGLEELLRTVFKVPVKNDYPVISVDTSVSIKVRDDDDVVADATDTSNDDNEDTSVETNEYLNVMFDKKLLQQYKHINPQNTQLKLTIRPLEATLCSIFAVPMLYREIVEEKPHLKGGYQRIEKAFKESKSYEKVKELTYELADEIGKDSYKRTVIAEATIRCMEFFQVKDRRSGDVVEGMQDGAEEEEVVHVVRFEVVTDKRRDGELGREVGNWKIIDWDDMLDGNIFH